MPITYRRIESYHGETSCAQCSLPLPVNISACFLDDGTEPYCGVVCASKWELPPTQHGPYCERVFGRYDADCARCRELANGAERRSAWGRVA